MTARQNRMLDDTDELIALDAPQPTAKEVRVKNLKVSAALAPKLYYDLVDFCAAASRAVGTRVTHVEVLRILVGEMLADEQLRNRVTTQLRMKGAQR